MPEPVGELLGAQQHQMRVNRVFVPKPVEDPIDQAPQAVGPVAADQVLGLTQIAVLEVAADGVGEGRECMEHAGEPVEHRLG